MNVVHPGSQEKLAKLVNRVCPELRVLSVRKVHPDQLAVPESGDRPAKKVRPDRVARRDVLASMESAVPLGTRVPADCSVGHNFKLSKMICFTV